MIDALRVSLLFNRKFNETIESNQTAIPDRNFNQLDNFIDQFERAKKCNLK